MEQTTAGKGSLSKNRDKATEKHPDYKGSLTLDVDLRRGDKVWLAAWINTGEDGSKYMSLKATKAQPQQSTQFRRQPDRQTPLDDDIPF